jgi:predicted ATPase
VGDFALCARRLDDAYGSTRTALDRVEAWRVGIAARVAQRDLLGAISLARRGLAELGVTLPDAPTQSDIGRAVQRAMTALAQSGVARIEHLADVQDPLVRAAMTLLVDTSSSAYYAMPALLPVIACELVVSSSEKGPSSATPFGLALYGLVLNAIGRLPEAHELGQAALRMLDRWEDRRLEVRTRLVVHNNVCSWTVPLQSTLDPLLDTYRRGRATGDFEFAAIAAQCWATNAFVGGVPLGEVERMAAELGQFMRDHQQNTALILHRPLEQLVGAFRGRAASPGSLSYAGFDEEETLAAAERAGSASVAFVTLSDMLVARYHFGDPEDAWRVAERAAPFQAGAASTHHLATYHLYVPLAAARLVSGT